VIGGAVIGAAGYAVMDLMPWSMLGEVVDEDDLETGERREGTYYGLFMFVRKLAGALAVWLALTLLGVLGYEADRPAQRRDAHRVRWLTSLAPAAFLVLAAWLARGYQLTRCAPRGDPRGARAPLGGPTGRSPGERARERRVGDRAYFRVQASVRCAPWTTTRCAARPSGATDPRHLVGRHKPVAHRPRRSRGPRAGTLA
jgi:hypothetical protein